MPNPISANKQSAMHRRIGKQVFISGALLAFLVSLFLPFFAVYQSSHSDAEKITSLFGEQVLICTSEGFRLVDRKDLADIEKSPESHPRFQCALCYVSAYGQGISPSASPAVLSVTPPDVRAALFYISHEAVSDERYWQQRLTRSPPLHIA